MSFVRCILFSAILFMPALTWAKPPVVTPPETPVLGEVDPFLLKTLYNSKDPDAGLHSIQDNSEFQKLIQRHSLQLFGGPLLGCVTTDSAKIWLRTPQPADVQIDYWPVENQKTVSKTAIRKTTATGDYTTILSLANLQPFQQYGYAVLVDGKRVPLKTPPVFRTNPANDQQVKFSVAFGGGARYMPDKERIWSTIAKVQPHAFLFLGDNLYIDEPEWRGKQRAMYYRRQLRPEFQELTSQAAAYAIWDDHDFGKNDVAGGPAINKPAWKIPAWKVFRENWNNPAYGGGEEQPGCWFRFSIGDVDFFMTDGRYYRSFKEGTMLGPVQKQWLLKELKASKAKFKVIASGTLWTELADKGGKDSWWGVPEEREEIFSLIDRENINGVVLLSADRHRTDIYRIERPNGYDLYEFETSKLTNDHTHPTKPKAVFSWNKGNFYGLLTFDLTQADPVLTFDCIDIDGKPIHSFPLKLSQLQRPVENK